MSPNEALSVLDQAANVAHMSRSDHVKAQEALEVIARLIASIDAIKVPN